MQYPRRVEDDLTPHPCDCAQSRLTRSGTVSIIAVNFSRAVQPSAEFRPKLSGSAPSSGNRPPLRRAWWRFAERRVLPPGGARFELHLVTEQKPDPHNRITLSPTEADVFGQPLARIHWRVHEDDCRLFSQIAELAFSQWAAGPLARLATLKARDREAIRHDLVEGGGIYHPAGTTRMGARAADSVVDAQLRVHGLDGLCFPHRGRHKPKFGFAAIGAARGR